MDFTKRIYAFVTFLLCFTFILPQNVHGEEDKETEFRITILKTSGEPHVGMILIINGRGDKYLSNDIEAWMEHCRSYARLMERREAEAQRLVEGGI